MEFDMKLRHFLQIVSTTIVTLPITILSYDPVKQTVVKPKILTDGLVGYKGDSFFECGYVYAPYIPLIKTERIWT
jgi:hypothetical protein